MPHLLLVHPLIYILLRIFHDVIKPELIPGTKYAHLHYVIDGHDKAIKHTHAIGLDPPIDRKLVVPVLVHPLLARAVDIQVLVVVLAANDVKVRTSGQDMLHVLPFDQVQLLLVIGLVSRDALRQVVELPVTKNNLAKVLRYPDHEISIVIYLSRGCEVDGYVPLVVVVGTSELPDVFDDHLVEILVKLGYLAFELEGLAVDLCVLCGDLEVQDVTAA